MLNSSQNEHNYEWIVREGKKEEVKGGDNGGALTRFIQWSFWGKQCTFRTPQSEQEGG